jgi:hypothetical protein
MDDETFMANMNVSSNHSKEYWSQYGAPQPQHQEQDELHEDGEGLMDGPKGERQITHWKKTSFYARHGATLAWIQRLAPINQGRPIGCASRSNLMVRILVVLSAPRGLSVLVGGDQWGLPKMGGGSKNRGCYESK